MKDKNIKSFGFYDKNKNDLLSLLPEFKEEKQINILDLSGNIEEAALFYKSKNKKIKTYTLDLKKNESKNSHDVIIEYKYSKTDFFLPENKFDLVYMGDALTSLIDPWETLKIIKKSMKDSASLLFSVSNITNYAVFYYLL